MRQTSIDVYNEIKNNGLLSDLRFKVYSSLFKYGACTANELVKKMADSGDKLESRDFFAQRLSELRNLGVIREVNKRKCEITGRIAIVWEVTNNLPTEYKKPLTSKERMKKASLLIGDYLDGRVGQDSLKEALNVLGGIE
jgi:S-adenosylmethionine:diacylglycerol 3-amino-3-carboxypropyl transferase